MHRHHQHGRRTRLDNLLVELGLAPSRARAQDCVRRGLVDVAGVTERRPGARIDPNASIRLTQAVGNHVSRGALKLIAALEHFRFPITGVVALDVGASTGGFTQVLLERGAARVYAVDVGHDQRHARLAEDARVVVLEGCDARRLGRELVPEPVGALVADVSFISLTKALPVPLSLTGAGAWLVALIKPQFEVGRAAVGKGGIVRDQKARQRAVDMVCNWVAGQSGWRVREAIPSAIAGGSGNEEFLLGAVRDD